MIEKLTVRNFLSIREEQTVLNYAASKDDHKEEENVMRMKDGTRLLRATFLYGNNDTGKSNITKALEYLVHLMTNSPEDSKAKLGRKRFAFDPRSGTDASSMCLAFYINGDKYVLTVEFNDDMILDEMLVSYYTQRPTTVYHRFHKAHNNGEDEMVMEYSRKLGLPKKVLNDITSYVQDNCSVLVAFKRSHVVCPDLEKVYDYFNNRFPDRYTDVKTMTEFARNQLIHDGDGKARRFLEELLVLGGFEPCRLSINYTDDGPKIMFTYRRFGMKVDILENDEAKGKLRFLGMASWLFKQIKAPTFIMLDGIDKELHPNVRAFFFQAYLSTVKNTSQLLFTTHTFYLLDAPYIRKDILWETTMGKHFNTRIKGIREFGVPPANSYKNAYEKEMLGEHPKLGDPNLDLEKMGITAHVEKYNA